MTFHQGNVLILTGLVMVWEMFAFGVTVLYAICLLRNIRELLERSLPPSPQERKSQEGK